jgi:hypothetical protein
MTETELKNKMLAAYSRSFGNSESSLIAFAEQNNIENYKDYKKEFDAIQDELYSLIYDYTDADKSQLTGTEIKAMSKEYCDKKFPWINDSAFTSLMNYIGWMCWHEGILK